MRRAFTWLILSLVALLCRTTNAYYGFSANPADRANWPLSVIYPENALQLKMVQPDGQVRVFQRDPDDSHALVCPAPWVGEIRGRQTLVMTDPDFKGGQTGFVFDGGFLSKMLLDGKEYDIPRRDRAALDPKGLWPHITADLVAEATQRYGRHWVGRFTLWYRNPNVAAMLLVEVILLCLAAFALPRLAGVKVLAAALALVCFVGLVKTNSRGGMAALLFGIGCFGLFRLRTFLSWRRLVAVLLAFAAVFVVIWTSGMTGRFTTGMIHEGYSDVSRIPIWIEAPRMMVSSFWGWGLGNSGTAYMGWFQPFERIHAIAGLISTHLTWLVEFGWPMRCLYVFLWVCGLCLLAADARRGRSVLPLALWAAFFVGSVFNSLGIEWSLWVLPVAALALPAASRPWRRWRDYRVAGLVGCLLSIAVLVTFVGFGWPSSDSVRIAGGSRAVIVNGTCAEIWVVDDGHVLDGGYLGILGKELRRWYAANRDAKPMGIVRSLADVPKDAKRLVLAGKSAEAFLDGWKSDPARFDAIGEVVFLSPPFGWRKVPEDLLRRHPTTMLIGSLVRNSVENAGDLPMWVKSVRGCALYLNDWMRQVAR